jgi:hypothetical protein
VYSGFKLDVKTPEIIRRNPVGMSELAIASAILPHAVQLM